LIIGNREESWGREGGRFIPSPQDSRTVYFPVKIAFVGRCNLRGSIPDGEAFMSNVNMSCGTIGVSLQEKIPVGNC
jgi:hypothetical protein